jgi:protein translocase SecG subunit
MEGFQFFLLVSQIVIAVLLIFLVLIQKSDGDSLTGLSSGSNGLNSAISGRTGMSILNKVTMALIALFMINCLLLASITNKKRLSISNDLNQAIEEHNNKASSTNTGTPTNIETPANTKPTKPAIPTID